MTDDDGSWVRSAYRQRPVQQRCRRRAGSDGCRHTDGDERSRVWEQMDLVMPGGWLAGRVRRVGGPAAGRQLAGKVGGL